MLVVTSKQSHFPLPLLQSFRKCSYKNSCFNGVIVPMKRLKSVGLTVE